MTQPLGGLDERLKEWAFPKEAEYLDAINLHGGASAAARALGVDTSGICKRIAALKKRAEQQGYSPAHHMTRTVPNSFAVKRVSSYFKADDEGPGQWVISEPRREQLLAGLKAAAEALAEDIPRLDPLERPGFTLTKLCNLYTFTDYHLGMLTRDGAGGGGDWNLEIAERTLTGMFEQMITQAPRARVAIINQLGDFLHWDGLEPVTPTSGHPVDAAARYEQMVKVAIRVLRRLVDIALMRHDEVHIVMAEGNHDLASSAWLRQMFAALYEGDPRVTVNVNPLPYYAHRHGKTFLGFHHGHKKKKEALPLLFAAMFRPMWGLTEKGYIHTGHYHEVDEKEFPGIKVVQHPTLAAPDSHSGRGGWLSVREATVETYHEDFGRVGRTTVTPEMLSEAA